MKIELRVKTTYLATMGYNQHEEHKIYSDQLVDVYNNVGWYLDNLDYIPEYRLSWGNYSKKGFITPVKPKHL